MAGRRPFGARGRIATSPCLNSHWGPFLSHVLEIDLVHYGVPKRVFHMSTHEEVMLHGALYRNCSCLLNLSRNSAPAPSHEKKGGKIEYAKVFRDSQMQAAAEGLR
jgi:hypothetical protein